MSRSVFVKGVWLAILVHPLGEETSQKEIKYPVSGRGDKGCLQDRNNRYLPQAGFPIEQKGQQAPGGISVDLSYSEKSKRIMMLRSDFFLSLFRKRCFDLPA